MHLTTFTDYSLRVLMYLKLHEQELCRIAEVSEYFNISHNHTIKVVNNLAKLGLVETIRGKGGGIHLREESNKIKIGELIRELEPKKELVQCVSREGSLCTVAPLCKLTSVLDNAMNRFYSELNNYTLKDIITLDNDK